MTITDRQLKTLQAIEKFRTTGTCFIYPADAEECVDLGLLDPNLGQGRGYTLTDKGRAQL